MRWKAKTAPIPTKAYNTIMGSDPSCIFVKATADIKKLKPTVFFLPTFRLKKATQIGLKKNLTFL